MSGPDTAFAGVSPGLPIETGEPVFHAPWQAKAFALAVTLHEAGVFSWGEWAEALSRSCARRTQLAGDARSEAYAHAYFEAWTEALETLLESRGLTDAGQIESTAHIWSRAAEATPHGQPILFERGLEPR